MVIADINIAVDRKAIKHTHLSVFPPDARVHVSAPIDLSESDLKSYLISKLPWIKKQIQKIQAQPRQSCREYESGENIYLLGKRYKLIVRKNSQATTVGIKGKDVILEGRGLNTRTARERWILEWYKGELKCVLDRLMPRCLATIEEEPVDFEIRKMRNLWGSCNSKKRKISFNLVLARVPIRCIEYIIFHELSHLKIPNHSSVFIRKMDKLLPRWREIRNELNDFVALPIKDNV